MSEKSKYNYDKIGKFIPKKRESQDFQIERLEATAKIDGLPDPVTFVGKDGIERTYKRSQIFYYVQQIFNEIENGEFNSYDLLENLPPEIENFMREIVER